MYFKINAVSVKYILFFLLMLITKNFGQVDFILSTDQEYNDNPFRSALPTKSLISSVIGGVEIELDQIGIGYYGSYINFNAISERNFYWHQAAMWKNFENSALGFYAEQRINKSEYNYFDYSNITAYYKQQFNISSFYFSLTPNISITKYSKISILDNFKFNMGYFINRGFETGTTFIIGGGFNFKKYLDPVQSGVYSYYDDTNTLIEETYTDKNISSLSQIVTYGRVAQSITPTTGLAVQFTNRSIISGISNQVKELNMVYGDESEMFDDPVNNEGNGVAVELTQLIDQDFTLKVGFYLNNKFYPSQGIYDVIGNYETAIMRTDTQNLLNISLKKNISFGKAGETGMSIGLEYQYINNVSNSYWFNYKGNSVSLNFGFQL